VVVRLSCQVKLRQNVATPRGALVAIIFLAAAVPRAAAGWPVRPVAPGGVAVEREESAPVPAAGAAPAGAEALPVASSSPTPAAEPSPPLSAAAPPTPMSLRASPVASSGAAVGDRRNALYLEILGSALLGSFNYERRTAYNFCLRIGAAPLPVPGGPFAIFIPLTITKLLGTDGPWPELGFGATVFAAIYRQERNFAAAALFGGRTDSEVVSRREVFVHAFVGYRWAPPATDNSVVRIGITPLFFYEGHPKAWRLLWWGGLSLGRVF
jgi:hypothetical protein